jgi:hypothetical protein
VVVRDTMLTAQREFLRTLHSCSATALRHECSELQAQALAVIPRAQLEAHAASLGGDARDALVRALLRWFKKVGVLAVPLLDTRCSSASEWFVMLVLVGVGC